MPQIIDIYGNPLNSPAELREPQTSRTGNALRPMADYPVRGLTPKKLAGMLRDADTGNLAAQCDLFEEMEERDAHLMAEMGKRKRALLTLDYSIVPPNNADATEKKNTAWLQEIVGDMEDLDQMILDMADAIGKAFSFLELEWGNIGTTWFPKAHWREQGWFMHPFNEPHNIRLVSSDGQGEALQPFGWIRHIHKAKSGYVSRSALSRVLTWPFLFKNYGIRDLAELLEIFGIPIRLGKYPVGSTKEEKNTLLQALVNMGHNSAGIIPDGMEVEFKEAAAASHIPHLSLVEWCERSMSKAILGGTLTSQADGKSSTNALGNVHNEVRTDLRNGDIKLVANTLKRDLLYPLLALNGRAPVDPRRTPSIVFDTQEAEDLQQYATALPKLAASGLRIPVNWAHDKLRIPLAKDGEEIMRLSPPQAKASPAAPATAAASRVAACGHDHSDDPPDNIDHLTALGMAGWMPAMEEAINPLTVALNRALEEGRTLEQFRDELPELLLQMDFTPLADPLAKAAFMARLAGEAGEEP